MFSIRIKAMVKVTTMMSLELVCWLVVLRINVDLAIFQPYLDLEAGDNQSLKIQVARPEIEPRSSCSAIQELNHSATAAFYDVTWKTFTSLIMQAKINEVSIFYG